MTRVSSGTINLGVFLIILGSLLLASLTGFSPLDSIQSLAVVVAVFGVWLALVSVIMPAPAASYAATRLMFLGWGGILTGIGGLWFALYYGLAAIFFAAMLVVAGIGAVGYAFIRR